MGEREKYKKKGQNRKESKPTIQEAPLLATRAMTFEKAAGNWNKRHWFRSFFSKMTGDKLRRKLQGNQLKPGSGLANDVAQITVDATSKDRIEKIKKNFQYDERQEISVKYKECPEEIRHGNPVIFNFTNCKKLLVELKTKYSMKPCVASVHRMLNGIQNWIDENVEYPNKVWGKDFTGDLAIGVNDLIEK